jgi:hypothetical protein
MQKSSIGQGLYVILLLAFLALTTSAYSSLGFPRNCTLDRSYLKRQSNHSATSAVSTCLEEWFEELMVGWLGSVALGDVVQQFFQVFGVHFHGGGQFVKVVAPCQVIPSAGEHLSGWYVSDSLVL